MNGVLASAFAKSVGYAFAAGSSVFAGWKVSDYMWNDELQTVLSNVSQVKNDIFQTTSTNERIKKKIEKIQEGEKKTKDKTNRLERKNKRSVSKTDRFEKDLSRQKNIVQSLEQKIKDIPQKALNDFRDKLSEYISHSSACYVDAQRTNFSDGIIKFVYGSENCKKASGLTEYLFGYNDNILMLEIG